MIGGIIGTDQLTLSKALCSRMEGITIDRLTPWLTAVGRTVQEHVRPYEAEVTGRPATLPLGIR